MHAALAVNKPLLLLLFYFLTLNFTISAQQQNPPASWKVEMTGPKAFIENKGQFNNRNFEGTDQTLYGVNLGTVQVFFSKKGVTYCFEKKKKNRDREEDSHEPKVKFYRDIIQTEWIGANKNAKIIPIDKTPDYHSYSSHVNNEVGKFNHIPAYKKIVYKELYPKIDIEFTFHPVSGIKYSLILHPGADPSQIKIKYTTAHSNTKKENTTIQLNQLGELDIKTSLGDIIEHKPYSFYSNTRTEIKSNYVFNNNVLGFELDNYDKTQEVIIDPWVVSPAFNSSTAVWEVETDGVGNVYVIGGETPMELKKYNSAGTLQWSYNTPWDTANVWLGTLATDVFGNSYITSGVSPEMVKINNAGLAVWPDTSIGAGGALGTSDEFWSITFNCDHTKLIVGGTKGPPLIGFDFYAAIYEIDATNGDLIDSVLLDHTVIGGIGSTPVEVRSLTSSKNAKYIFLTHNDVGAISHNLDICPTNKPIFQVDNTHNLGYKCENYLPESQNGGGLKALTANDRYFYTHAGNQIHRWNLGDGTKINSVTLPGGSATSGFGGIVVSNSGLDVDSCGNVYAGSMNTVVKFDSALNILSQASVSFTVYDVSVNSNGEILAVGAQNPNNNANRNGRIESVNLNACAQYTVVCCDANVCPAGPFCDTDPVETLIASTPGGVWSGPGITNASTGTFDPSVSGSGTFTIVYTLSCGSDSLTIDVSTCTPLTVCLENNGDLTAVGGSGPYTWQEEITTQDCSGCLIPIVCQPAGCETSVTSWSTYATTVTATPPGTFPIQLYETPLSPLVITSLSGIPACSACGMTSTETATNETCVGNDGTATANPSGGTTPYTYSWNTSPVQTGQVATGLAAGTYSVLITDNTGCTETKSVTINSPPSTLTATTIQVNTSCNGACNGTATVSPSNGTSPYTYQWEATAGSQTTAMATGLCANTYSVTVTDAGGCTVISSAIVNEPATLTIIMDSTAVSCNGASDGSATATPGGGASPYQYNWSSGHLTSAAVGLSAGTYTVIVTDNNSCAASETITITEPASMGPSVTPNDANCGAADGSASISLSGGSSPFTYSWSNGQTTSTDTGLVAGVYAVTITDASGCIEIASTVVNTIGGPTLSITSADITCNGDSNGTGTVTPTGGAAPYTYLWNDPSAQSTGNATGLTGGIFNVSVTDTAGCIAIAMISIVEPSALAISLSSTAASCGLSDGSASSLVTGGIGSYTYTWSPTGGTVNTETNLTSGTYTLTVSDSNSCSTIDSVVVASAGGPVAGISNTVNATCFSANDGTATVAVLGGSFPLTYSWSPTGGNDTTAAGLGPGTYTVTVTDSGGCTSTASTLITSPPDIVLSITANMISCSGNLDGSATVNASGGSGAFTYLWNPTADTVPAIMNLSSGSYQVLVTDANGCTNSDTVSIVDPAPINLSLSSIPATCGVSDGAAIVSTSGGSAPYSYAWWPAGSTNDTASSISVGVYTVTVTDSAGCFTVDSVIVNNSGAQTVSILGSTNVSCSGGTNGTATVDVVGGTLPYTYAWSTSPTQTDSVATALGAGNYNCTVTDAALCIAIVPVTILEPNPIVMVPSPNLAVCPGEITTLSVSTSGGVMPYVFTWNNGLGNDSVHTVTITQDSIFTVIVVDDNLCPSSPESISFTVGAPVSVAIQGGATSTCPGVPTILTAAGVGGAPSYTYTWSNGDTGPVISVSPNTTTPYTVTVTDSCGLQNTASVNVIINPNLVLNPPFDTICPGDSTTIKATGAVDYWWLDALTLDTMGTKDSITVSPSTTTSYIIVAGDGVCLNVTDTAVVTVINSLVAAFMVDPEVATIFEPTFQFTDLSLGDPISWFWGFGDTGTSAIQHPSHTYTDTGNYEVMLLVGDGNGCKDSVYFTIEVKETYSLFTPNSFSPNGDGVNDYFFPFGLGIQDQGFEFYVFDRWGDLIFSSTGEFGSYESSAAQIGWNGKANHGNKIAQEEVYVWMIKTMDPENVKHQYVGHVTLIR